MRVSERGPGKPYWKMPEGLTGAGMGGRGCWSEEEKAGFGGGGYGDVVGIVVLGNEVPLVGLETATGLVRSTAGGGAGFGDRDVKNALARPAPAAALATPTKARVLRGILQDGQKSGGRCKLNNRRSTIKSPALSSDSLDAGSSLQESLSMC